MKFSLQALRYLITAAEEGSVTRAAHRLNVSQPSVSGAITHLESVFEQQLFVRKRARGIFLTPTGEQLVREARALVRHAEEFQAMTGALESELRGTLRVACFVNLAPAYFAGVINEFERLHPGIAVQFREGHQEELLEGVRSGLYELALTFDLGDVEEFEHTVLAEVPPHVIVADDHSIAKRQSISLRAVADEPFILLDLPHSRDYFLGLFHSVGVRPNLRYRTTSFEMARSLAGNGLGIAVLNLIPQSPITYDGTRVHAIPISECVRSLKIICVRLPDMPLRRISRAFLDFAREHFARAANGAVGCGTAVGHEER